MSITVPQLPPTYDKQWFIDMFSAVPDHLWCIGVFWKELPDGQIQHCARGRACWLGEKVLTAFDRLKPHWGGHGWAYVNDGNHPAYQQPTPRARILAALRDLP